MKKVAVTSTFPATIQVIWPLLTNIKTLQYIASPLATFIPLSSDTTWRENTTLRFRLRIFGFIPMGVHTIHVRRFDSSAHIVQTEESNRWVPVWNHTILLEPSINDSVLYTDLIEIDAGWRSTIVCIWSKWFYRHRQQKWRKLLRTLK